MPQPPASSKPAPAPATDKPQRKARLSKELRIRGRPGSRLPADADRFQHPPRADSAVARFQPQFFRWDVRPGVFSAMLLANANPGIAQTDIANQLGIDKASVVSLIDRMEHAGWVERRRSTEDRRRQGIFLTARGREGLPLAEEGNDRPRAQVREPLHRAGTAPADLAAAPAARRRLTARTSPARRYRLRMDSVA